MSADLESPSWRGSSPPPESSNGSKDADVVDRFSADSGSDNAIMRATPNAICNGESSVGAELDACNNNMSEFGVKDAGGEVSCECSDGKSKPAKSSVRKGLKKRRCSKKRKFSGRRERRSEDTEMCQPSTRINGENKLCGISSEHNLATVGGDGEENRRERLRCRQHELNPSSNEINRSDVITSCDLTSNSVSDEGNDQNKNGKKDCPGSRCSASRSTCSEGSYSRRRHHKHHKHKNKSPTRSEEDVSSINPKVNPIFLWVRQEDTRIVEVVCEDYDRRNRLRLRRTHLGWRAIPKTNLFAEAIAPKVTPKDEVEEEDEVEVPAKPKQLKKMQKRKKTKKKRCAERSGKTVLPDNLIKECSVALCRDDLVNYESKRLVKESPEEASSGNDADAPPTPEPAEPSEGGCDPGLNQSWPSPPRESIDNPLERLNTSKKLVKSNSCDFPSLTKVLESLPRSISLDLNLRKDNNEFKVQKETMESSKADEAACKPIETAVGVKNEPEMTERSDVEEPTPNIQEEALTEKEAEEANDQRNHSESLVMDMTKHDSDLNDTDCDELGQLLKDIPDLEFVEEADLEEVDEDEEWSTPTDLTLPKSTTEGQSSGLKLPILPPNISPLVTVTSSVRPPEPLTAPLPEVTITPIPNPKPAHQQKLQNNFLENLLSSSNAVKPESEDVQKAERRTFDALQKTSKHFLDNDFVSDAKSKKLKVEDITLKNLLSRHQSGRTIKPFDLEKCVQNMKMMEGEECSKSRLQELLTDSVSSDPISQLKEVLSNPHLPVPDPLLVPRARLPALVASPASEIPRLLTMHLEKAIEETPCPPVTDSDVLEVSLSNLQSLLSCTPEKMKSWSKSQDLANYQKSLETFLEWQRYQTELMEAQMKSSKPLSSGFTGDMADVAAATAFSQMLWLPYLNQFDFNCNTNRDIMSLMNSMLASDYQSNAGNLTAPPQINISQVPQPSPFLTPTSPMDIESHLKTLAMWQEAIMMQQNSQASRACSKVSTPNQDLRRSAKATNVQQGKKQVLGSGGQSMRGSSISPISSRGDSLQNGHLGFEIYQDVPMTPNDYPKKRQNVFQQRMEEHQKQLELQQQKYKQEQQNQFRKMQRSYANYRNELLRQCKLDRKKSGPMHGSISVKPLSNLMDKSGFVGEGKNLWEQFEGELRKSGELANQTGSRLSAHAQKNRVKEEKPLDWHPHEAKSKFASEKQKEVKGGATDAPKLKVKNLVDPNMSPPKLLKQIAPEHMPIVMDERGPMQDDAQAHLWHPLFGSNQIKPQQYNSPWRWTTVTVNGE